MINAKLTGIPDMRSELAGIVPKLRARALRNALAAGGRVVRNAARAKTPTLRPSHPSVLLGRRTSGLVRKALSVRTSKRARAAGDVGVYVNVRPAKGGARGAKSARDPFYWQWLNFGWTPASGRRGKAGRKQRRAELRRGVPRQIRGARFLEAGAAVLPQALTTFSKAIGPQIQKLNVRRAPTP